MTKAEHKRLITLQNQHDAKCSRYLTAAGVLRDNVKMTAAQLTLIQGAAKELVKERLADLRTYGRVSRDETTALKQSCFTDAALHVLVPRTLEHDRLFRKYVLEGMQSFI